MMEILKIMLYILAILSLGTGLFIAWLFMWASIEVLRDRRKEHEAQKMRDSLYKVTKRWN